MSECEATPTQTDCSGEACRLCLSDVDDEFRLGKKYKSDDGIIAHYYCILFACGLNQSGEEDEGILGFMSSDLLKEIRRASRLSCSFCKKKGAASACAVPKCRTKYHLPCALPHFVLLHFFEEFPSYCVAHRPAQEQQLSAQDQDMCCYICLEHFVKEQPITSLKDWRQLAYQLVYTGCCRKWLHIDCVQAHAYSAGAHHIKCPLCNDKDKFINCIKLHGVYIPEKDASWEDTQRYRDLETAYEHCDALQCLCPQGRTFNLDYDKWEIHVCITCGSSGVHAGCSNEPVEFLKWSCESCLNVINRLDKSQVSTVKDNYFDQNFAGHSTSTEQQNNSKRQPSDCACQNSLSSGQVKESSISSDSDSNSSQVSRRKRTRKKSLSRNCGYLPIKKRGNWPEDYLSNSESEIGTSTVSIETAQSSSKFEYPMHSSLPSISSVQSGISHFSKISASDSKQSLQLKDSVENSNYDNSNYIKPNIKPDLSAKYKSVQTNQLVNRKFEVVSNFHMLSVSADESIDSSTSFELSSIDSNLIANKSRSTDYN